MTRKTFECAVELASEIDNLKQVYDSLKNDCYVQWHLRGILGDGVEDYVGVLDEEVMEQIRKAYEIKIARAENNFRNL